MGALTAQALYGGATQLQPTPSPVPVHEGNPEPTMATRAPAKRTDSPVLAVVVLLGLVVLLTQVSFRGTVSVKG